MIRKKLSLVLEFISMNNPFAKAIKFITVFVFSTGIMLSLFYFFKDSPFAPHYLSLSPGKNKQLCQDSPEKEPYSRCINRFLVPLIEKASPLELLKVPKLIRSIKEQDLFLKLHPKNKLFVEYIKNQLTFFENLQHFKLSRNNLDFFQILVKPAIVFFLKKEISDIKKEIENADGQGYSEEDKETLRRFMAINLTQNHRR